MQSVDSNQKSGSNQIGSEVSSEGVTFRALAVNRELFHQYSIQSQSQITTMTLQQEPPVCGWSQPFSYSSVLICIICTCRSWEMAMQGKPCVYFAWVSTFLWRHWFDCDRICDGGLCCANVMNQGDPDCDFNSHQIQPLSVVETLLRLSDSVWIRSELSAHIQTVSVGCWRYCSTVNLQYIIITAERCS